MRLTKRHLMILELLWRCGGVATASQLVHQAHDRGKDNSRFRQRLFDMVSEGYTELIRYPTALDSHTLERTRQCYMLSASGSRAIGKEHSRPTQEETAQWLLKSEVVRQMAACGYALLPRDAHGLPAQFMLFDAGELRVVAVWSPGNGTRLARASVGRFLAEGFDERSTSLIVAFVDPYPYLCFTDLVGSADFRRACPFHCTPVMAQWRLPFATVAQAKPFEGWRETQWKKTKAEVK